MNVGTLEARHIKPRKSLPLIFNPIAIFQIMSSRNSKVLLEYISLIIIQNARIEKCKNSSTDEFGQVPHRRTFVQIRQLFSNQRQVSTDRTSCLLG